jgi:hypothetical protein
MRTESKYEEQKQRGIRYRSEAQVCKFVKKKKIDKAIDDVYDNSKAQKP